MEYRNFVGRVPSPGITHKYLIVFENGIKRLRVIGETKLFHCLDFIRYEEHKAHPDPVNDSVIVNVPKGNGTQAKKLWVQNSAFVLQR